MTESRRLADLRMSYDVGALREADLDRTPLGQFQHWLDEAVAAGGPDPNGLVLATSVDGQPSARSVLLKEADSRGFAFYTNLGSRKSAELAANPRASMVFPWYAMHRQVVVVGDVELLPRDEVEAYFASRPHDSKLGAWASKQSSVIPDRGVLASAFAQLQAQYPDDVEVPVPEWWGGWLVRPQTVEFWQGQPSRLHDRLRFRFVGEGHPDLADPAHWIVERLSP